MSSQARWITLFIMVLLMAATPLIKAQQNNQFKTQLLIGVGGGSVFTKVDFVPGIPQNTTQGLSLGISAKFVSEKNLGVLAELNFTQRGWTEDFSDLNIEHSYSRTLNYIELPLLTHIYFGNKVRFVLNLGPQLSYMLGDKPNMNDALASYVEEQQSAQPDGPVGVQYESIDNKFDYGLLGGMGMEFNTGIGSFDLEGRYYFGLGDSFDNTRSKATNFSRSAHRYFAGKLTYFFKVF
ncbi:MAG: porin family protein [Candidatus Saccharimonadaceae bacterium]